jgi:hypothetical protein
MKIAKDHIQPLVAIFVFFLPHVYGVCGLQFFTHVILTFLHFTDSNMFWAFLHFTNKFYRTMKNLILQKKIVAFSFYRNAYHILHFYSHIQYGIFHFTSHMQFTILQIELLKSTFYTAPKHLTAPLWLPCPGLLISSLLVSLQFVYSGWFGHP